MHINNGNLSLAPVAALQPKYFISTAIYIVHLPLKGAVSQNSAKLGNYKMPVKLRET